MLMYLFRLNVTEIYYQWSSQQYFSIRSENGLAPTRRQAIIWTNVDRIHWRIDVAQGGDELKAPVGCFLLQ